MALLRKFDPALFHRRSIRLKGYDYSRPGIYFFTTCTHFREPLFGTYAHGKIILNSFGKIVKTTWFDLPRHNQNITLDAFVVMPDHFHGIIIINHNEINLDETVDDGEIEICTRVGIDIGDAVGAGSEPAPTANDKSEPAPTANGKSEPAPTANDKSEPAPTAYDNNIPNPVKQIVRTQIRKQQPLSEIIRQFKTFSALRINELRKTMGVPVWQRNYYESIVRGQINLDKVRRYIHTNPQRLNTLNEY